MNPQPDAVDLYVPGTKKSLHQLVNDLVQNFLPVATRKRIFIVNEVPAAVCVNVDENLLSSVLGDLLNSVVSNAKKTCIQISAKVYGNIVLIHMRDDNSFIGYSIAPGLQKAKILAEKIGGYLDITSRRDKIMTVEFSFSNLLQAA